VGGNRSDQVDGVDRIRAVQGNWQLPVGTLDELREADKVFLEGERCLNLSVHKQSEARFELVVRAQEPKRDQLHRRQLVLLFQLFLDKDRRIAIVEA